MKRLTVLAGAGVLTLATTLAASGAYGGSAADTSEDATTTTRVHSSAFTQTRLPVPADPDAHLRAGDRLLWVTELSSGATHVGSAPQVCTIASGRWLVCRAGALLSKGQIQLPTTLDPNPRTLSATGSGCYRYVRGQLVIAFNDDGSSCQDIDVVVAQRHAQMAHDYIAVTLAPASSR
jgi:hypothetical protein